MAPAGCSQGKFGVFTRSDFHRIGRSLLHSLLDLFTLHPNSLLPASEYKSIENIRKKIAHSLKKEYALLERGLERQFQNINQIIEEHYSNNVKSAPPQPVQQPQISASIPSRRSQTSLNIIVKKQRGLRVSSDIKEYKEVGTRKVLPVVLQRNQAASDESLNPSKSSAMVLGLSRTFERNELIFLDQSAQRFPSISPDFNIKPNAIQIDLRDRSSNLTKVPNDEIQPKFRARGFEVKTYAPKLRVTGMTKLIVKNLQEKKPPEEPVSKSLHRKIIKPARAAPLQQVSSAQKAKYFLLDQNAPSLRKVVLNPENHPLTLSKMLPTKAKDEQLKQQPTISLPLQGVSSRREPAAKSSNYPSLDKKPTEPTSTLKSTSFLRPRASPSAREEPQTAKAQDADKANNRITAVMMSKQFSKQAFSFRLFESWKELG